MVDNVLLDRAGSCYLRLGLVEEAARCYREAGAFGKSGGLFAGLGRHHDAAADYAAAGMNELAGWTLVHFAGDPAAARAHLASPAPGTPPTLRHRLVVARCDIAEGATAQVALPVFEAAQTEFAHLDTPHDLLAEQWAIALAEILKRYDQVALMFAAAVRGRKFGAARRWAQWSARVLHTDLVVPAAPVTVHTNPITTGADAGTGTAAGRTADPAAATRQPAGGPPATPTSPPTA